MTISADQVEIDGMQFLGSDVRIEAQSVIGLEIRHVHASRALTAAITIDDSAATITDSLIEDDPALSSTGIVVSGSSDVLVTASTLRENATGIKATGGQTKVNNSFVNGNETGVLVSSDAAVTLFNNDLSQNSGVVIGTSSSQIVDASGNWLGSADPAAGWPARSTLRGQGPVGSTRRLGWTAAMIRTCPRRDSRAIARC